MTFNEKIAPIGDIIFNIERDLDGQVGAQSLPFAGMDKSSASVCVRHLRDKCDRPLCPFKHLKGDRTVVCKHWLRGLCKKGDSCEFLHQYDMSRMPVCFFFSRYQSCSNKECSFLHIDPNSQIAECGWYERGFCRHGNNCRKKHTRRFPCYNYLCGFCPDGPDCKFVHVKFDIPETKGLQGQHESNRPEHHNSYRDNNPHHNPHRERMNRDNGDEGDGDRRGMERNHMGRKEIICNYCREPGHKIYHCTKIPADKRDETIQTYLQNQQKRFESRNMNKDGERPGNNSERPPQQERFFKSLDQVTCFKCGQNGHFANKCPNGFKNYKNQANKGFNNNENHHYSMNQS